MTPDPKFLYLSQQHKQALAHLIYGVKEKKGITLLTGEIGTGKTTIINAMLEKVDQAVRITHVSNPNMVLEDLFTYIFDGFKIDAPVISKSKCLIKLRDFLLRQTRKGINSILIIDEAQNLSLDILEEIRLLSNLETKKEKLIQILLVGQPELNFKLANPKLRQLRQRISAKFHIVPLNIKEVQEYISQRLGVAGISNIELFNKKAINEIFFYTHGIPRLINVICDLSLVMGFAFQKARIDERIIKEAVKSLSDNHSPGVPDKSPPPEKAQKMPETRDIVMLRENIRAKMSKSPLRSLGIWLISCLVFGIILLWAWDLSIMVKTINQTIGKIAPSRNYPGLRNEPPDHEGSVTEKPDKAEPIEQMTEPPPSSIIGGDKKEKDTAIPQMDTESNIHEQEENRGQESLQSNESGEQISLKKDEPEIVPERVQKDVKKAATGSRLTPRNNKTRERLMNRGKKIAVKRGDTLTGLAVGVYGLASREIFSLVRAANPGIADINRIRIGQQILFPDLPASLSLPFRSSHESFGVQVDVLRELEKANSKLLQLMEKGYRPLLIPVNLPQGERLYRVILGIFSDESEAINYGDSLKTQEEFPSIVIIPLPQYEAVGSQQ
jgi:type II secretory pathway predicted ATPase ExeA/phage tail protein X